MRLFEMKTSLNFPFSYQREKYMAYQHFTIFFVDIALISCYLFLFFLKSNTVSVLDTIDPLKMSFWRIKRQGATQWRWKSLFLLQYHFAQHSPWLRQSHFLFPQHFIRLSNWTGKQKKHIWLSAFNSERQSF